MKIDAGEVVAIPTPTPQEPVRHRCREQALRENRVSGSALRPSLKQVTILDGALDPPLWHDCGTIVLEDFNHPLP